MKNFPFVFCCGFPKCGTTTVAALLDSFSECSLHILKEPNFFLKESLLTAEYIRQFPDRSAKYLVDFSTFYGLKSKRKVALANIAAAGLMENARFVVCIRNPLEQATSYLKHIKTWQIKNLDSIQVAIEDSQDFRQCSRDLLSFVKPQRVFIIKFEDIKKWEAQNILARQLRAWLNLPVSDMPREFLKLNSAEDYAEYQGIAKEVAETAKKLGIAKFFSLQHRKKLRNIFGSKMEEYVLSTEDREILGSLNFEDALSFYLESHTGILGEISPS